MTNPNSNFDSETETKTSDFDIAKEPKTEKAPFLFKKSKSGLEFNRYFTKKDIHPYDEITWESRDASITNSEGEVVFSQKGVEIPKTWSQTATNIAVPHYFRGRVGTKD